MRQILHAMAFVAALGLTGGRGQAADYSAIPAPALVEEGVPCVFQDWGPTIVLPWPSVWLGHFAGGRFINTEYGPVLDWYDHKLCFPSKASCNRWIGVQRRAFHHPEGDWTCLPIR